MVMREEESIQKHKTQTLELSNRGFKITMKNMSKSLIEKLDITHLDE